MFFTWWSCFGFTCVVLLFFFQGGFSGGVFPLLVLFPLALVDPLYMLLKSGIGDWWLLELLFWSCWLCRFVEVVVLLFPCSCRGLVGRCFSDLILRGWFLLCPLVFLTEVPCFCLLVVHRCLLFLWCFVWVVHISFACLGVRFVEDSIVGAWGGLLILFCWLLVPWWGNRCGSSSWPFEILSLIVLTCCKGGCWRFEMLIATVSFLNFLIVFYVIFHVPLKVCLSIFLL